MEWRERAACRMSDSDLFMPGSTRVAQAKAICFWCPVREKCLEQALLLDADGIWGGMTHQERLRLRLPTMIASERVIIRWEV